jgi:hypothetical protein
MTKEQRRRLATIRALAPLAAPTVRDRQRQAAEEIEDDDANPAENLPAVSHASHYS